jgi:hypothetical protein
MTSTNILPLKPDFLALAKAAAVSQRKHKVRGKKRKSAPPAIDAPSTVLTIAEAHATPS